VSVVDLVLPRIQNFTAKTRCPSCDDEAVVLVTEGAAPCPFCERGFRLEFGLGVKNGEEYENPEGGPWGKAGFWRGRSPAELLA
jgi:hypothetical protein